ncbi:phospholipase A and acyltransferase 3-like, partial [Chiloscyllium punctatum]|uniref:phospholipase A and acyltransferase 3-like n=1 Tax=Chiloscyllium punctatum TaxID=137246 RepID=UPI003B632642
CLQPLYLWNIAKDSSGHSAPAIRNITTRVLFSGFSSFTSGWYLEYGNLIQLRISETRLVSVRISHGADVEVDQSLKQSGSKTRSETGNPGQSVDPKPGDLIEITRDICSHWAIYIGDGYVIHLTSDGQSDSASVFAFSSSAAYAVVKKELLIDVAGRNHYKVNNKSDAIWNPLPVNDILKNAEARVGERRNYYITKANCEHFVNELRYGKSVSYQVLCVALGVIVGLIGFGIEAAGV